MQHSLGILYYIADLERLRQVTLPPFLGIAVVCSFPSYLPTDTTSMADAEESPGQKISVIPVAGDSWKGLQ